MKTFTVLKKDYVCFIKYKLNWDRKKSSQIIIYVVTYISWQAASGMTFDYKVYQMWASVVHLSAFVRYLW